jgi:hypothetical protein
MKSLHTLLKVAQRRMDELGVEAAKIQVQIDELRAKQGGILAREKSRRSLLLPEMTMFASMLPAYRMRVKQQVAEVEREVNARDAVLLGISATSCRKRMSRNRNSNS